MKPKLKWVAAAISIAFGISLIGWNLRDPDAAFREPPKEKRVVTIDQVPLSVQGAIKQMSAGGTIEDIQEKQQGSETSYEVDVIRGDTKTEIKFAENGSVIKQKSKKVKRQHNP